MTLVARFLRRGVPFMMGDLLVSTPSWKDVNSNLPTIPQRAQAMTGVTLGAKDWAASGLVQKVILFSENVVIGWAGRMKVARDIVGELRRDLMDVENTSQIQDALNRISDAALKEVDILGFALLKGQVIPFNAGENITTVESPGFQELALTGSGRNSFLTQGFGELVYRFSESEMTSWTQAVVDVTQLVGRLIAWEMVTLETLLTLYGGGFEFVFPNYGKFKKFDETLYTVWQATFIGDDVAVDFVHMFKYAYSSDDLLIRVVDVDLKAKRAADTCFYVPPVDSQKSHTELLSADKPDMKSKVVTILVVVADEGPIPRGTFTLFLHQPDLDKLRVNYTVGQDGLGSVLVEMDELILEAVRGMARNGRKAGDY